MKATCEKEPLQRALERAKGFTEPGSKVPAMQSIAIEAEGDQVTLTAASHFMTYRESLAAEVGEPGGLAVPADQVLPLVRAAPEGSQIELTMGKGLFMRLRDGRGSYRLGGLPVGDLVLMAEPEAAAWQAPTGFFELLKRCAYCMSSEQTRSYLCGVMMGQEDAKTPENLTLVATDGKMLHSGTLAAGADLELPAEPRPADPDKPARRVILPAGLVKALPRVVEEGDAVTVKCGPHAVSFRCDDGRVLVSKLVDGTFPDWQRVLPAAGGAFFECAAEDLVHVAAKIQAIAVASDVRYMALRIAPAKTLVAFQGAQASGLEELAADYNGEGVEITFAPELVTRYINALGERLRIYPDGLRAVRFESEGRPGEAGVIMPNKSPFPEGVLEEKSE